MQTQNQTKSRKTQDDRLLKRLPLGERRKQEVLRRMITAEQVFAIV
jgi:hypothetical protein